MVITTPTTVVPRRIAQIIGIAPEHIDQYEALHRAIWPTVSDRLSRSNIRNYSIWRHDATLFAYFEYVGNDFDADMDAVAADPETQRWWDICMPMQRPLPERPPGSWWLDLPEIFHLD